VGTREIEVVKRLIVTAALVVILVAAGVLFAHARAERARFLMLPADAITDDAELTRYALSKGAGIYAENCARCHGDHMQGDPVNAVPNLADGDLLYGAGRVSEIEHVVLYGIRSGNTRGWDLAHMPAFATEHPYNLYAIAPLRPTEIDDVTTYLLSFQQAQGDAAAVERGKHLFYEPTKGNCIDCHGTDAKGDSAIGAPDLTDKIWLRGDGSRQSVADSIAYGLTGRCPAWITQLSSAEARAVAVYVYAAGPKRGKLD